MPQQHNHLSGEFLSPSPQPMHGRYDWWQAFVMPLNQLQNSQAANQSFLTEFNEINQYVIMRCMGVKEMDIDCGLLT